MNRKPLDQRDFHRRPRSSHEYSASPAKASGHQPHGGNDNPTSSPAPIEAAPCRHDRCRVRAGSAATAVPAPSPPPAPSPSISGWSTPEPGPAGDLPRRITPTSRPHHAHVTSTSRPHLVHVRSHVTSTSRPRPKSRCAHISSASEATSRLQRVRVRSDISGRRRIRDQASGRSHVLRRVRHRHGAESSRRSAAAESRPWRMHAGMPMPRYAAPVTRSPGTAATFDSIVPTRSK